MKIRTKITTLLLVLAMLASLSAPALAAETAVGSVIRLTKTEGTVKISKSNGKSVSLRDDVRLYNGYHVATEKESYAWINLDDTKLIKEDASSEVEVRKSGKKLEVNISSGAVFFDVSQELEDDETLNISTSTMVVGIRGTSGWVRVTDRWRVEVCIAEGESRCVVSDPVTGQLKTAVLESGDVAECVVYPQDREGEKCDILMGKPTINNFPGFVLAQLVEDVGLCDRILDKSGLDILAELAKTAGGDSSGRTSDGKSASAEVLGEADRRLKEDEDEAGRKLEEIDEALNRQEHNVSEDPVWENAPEPPAADDDADRDDNGGGTEPAAPTAVTRTMPVTASELQILLNQYNSVTVQPNTDAANTGADKNVLKISSALNVPAGKTLTLENGISVNVESGQTLNVDGTMHVEGGNLTNNGNIKVTTGDTLRVKGDLSGSGSVEVTATGKLVVDGTFDKPGTFLLTKGARVLAKIFGFTDFPVNWEKSGPDSDGYHSLDFVDLYIVTFDLNDIPWVQEAPAPAVTGTDGKITLPELTSSEGCSFYGWYTEQNGGEEIQNKTVFTSNQTVYAHWLYFKIEDDDTVSIGARGDTVFADNQKPWSDCAKAVITAGTPSIFSNMFKDCTSLISVTIPDSVTSIGFHAFEGCTGLTTIDLPSSVTSIGSGAFYGCTSLATINLPSSVTSIDISAFQSCTSLTAIDYGGTWEQWKGINIGSGGGGLFGKTIRCTDGTINPDGTFTPNP